jgi:hypothetical protein
MLQEKDNITFYTKEIVWEVSQNNFYFLFFYFILDIFLQIDRFVFQPIKSNESCLDSFHIR